MYCYDKTTLPEEWVVMESWLRMCGLWWSRITVTLAGDIEKVSYDRTVILVSNFATRSAMFKQNDKCSTYTYFKEPERAGGIKDKIEPGRFWNWYAKTNEILGSIFAFSTNSSANTPSYDRRVILKVQLLIIEAIRTKLTDDKCETLGLTYDGTITPQEEVIFYLYRVLIFLKIDLVQDALHLLLGVEGH